MAEYIEREAVENMLSDAQIITDGEYCGYCTEDVDVSQLPAADVVEVVRCKDCKKSTRHEIFPHSRRCSVEEYRFPHKENHFCSYGERGDNDV